MVFMETRFALATWSTIVVLTVQEPVIIQLQDLVFLYVWTAAFAPLEKFGLRGQTCVWIPPVNVLLILVQLRFLRLVPPALHPIQAHAFMAQRNVAAKSIAVIVVDVWTGCGNVFQRMRAKTPFVAHLMSRRLATPAHHHHLV